jgi:hypothetical protein
VTPGGPAEKAGIIEVDRIVSINGVDLRLNSADAGDSYAAELPVRRLTREVNKLEPGKVATLRVWSGGRVRDVPVTIGRASDLREAGAFGLLDGMPRGRIMSVPDMSGLRMQLRDLDGMKFDSRRFNELQDRLMRIRDLDGRIRIERMAPLRDGARFRILAPSRVRGFDRHWIDDDDVIIDKIEKQKSDVEKERKEKAEKEKRDNDN